MRLCEHFFKQACALFVGCELEVVAALVACEGEQHHPLVLVAQERRYAVLAHVGSHGKRVDVILLEEGACIHGACVAYVAALGIGYDEVVGIVLLKIGHGLLEGHDALHTERLIESQVGLVCHTVGGCCVDNLLVEGEDGVILLQQVLRNLLRVCVETYAEEGLLAEYLVY